MTVNVVCALQHMKKTFRTKLARNGLHVPVANGYTRTVLKTVLDDDGNERLRHFCLDILS